MCLISTGSKYLNKLNVCSNLLNLCYHPLQLNLLYITTEYLNTKHLTYLNI